MISRALTFLLWTIPKKLIWWIFIRPPVIILMLCLYIVYAITRWALTKLLHIWYPNQQFI